jgi:hypothetical protein
LSLLPTALWMTGEPERAEEAVRLCAEHINAVGRDFDRALIECWFAGFRLTQQRWAESAAHAQAAFEISEHFANWRDLSTAARTIAEANLSCASGDIDRAIEALDAYEASGATATIPHYCVNLAHACVRAGDKARARTLVDRGFASARESEETRMLAELTILEAGLEDDAQLAMVKLQDAFELAEGQGSVAVALLAAATLAQRYGLPTAAEGGAALDILESRAPSPGPGWMRQKLETLRGAITPRSLAATA